MLCYLNIQPGTLSSFPIQGQNHSFKHGERHGFVTKLLEPGHAFPNRAWLQLIPKKLRLSVSYEPSDKTVL